MTWEIIETILMVLFAVISIVISFVTYYFSVRKKIAEAVAKEVNGAEVDGAVGEDKKAEVVEQLGKLVPTILKPFITDKVLETLTQAAFDSIEAYAKKQVAKEAGTSAE